MTPIGVSVSFQHDLYDLAEAVFKTRAIQAFESAATRYAIHRVVRCAARRKRVDVFDDLALKAGLAAQRLDEGSLLLEGSGVFVHAEGWNKPDYSSCTFHVWAQTLEHLEEVRGTLLNTVGERLLPQDMFVIDWQYNGGRGSVSSTSFEEVVRDVLLDEAYPTLGCSVGAFVERYLRAAETILVLQGSPGSGKTRLVRSILGAISKRRGESAEVMYTADQTVLGHDEVFVQFITGSYAAFVVEDADLMLKSRTTGNANLQRFLAIADGVIRAQGRKIIFTTNLPNVGDIDEALLRPGRCFAVIPTRALDRDEIKRLVTRLCGQGNLSQTVVDRVLASGSRAASVAQVYRACTDAMHE